MYDNIFYDRPEIFGSQKTRRDLFSKQVSHPLQERETARVFFNGLVSRSNGLLNTRVFDRHEHEIALKLRDRMNQQRSAWRRRESRSLGQCHSEVGLCEFPVQFIRQCADRPELLLLGLSMPQFVPHIQVI